MFLSGPSPGQFPKISGIAVNQPQQSYQMGIKQWQKHHKKDQTTANRMTEFFYQLGTAEWPRNKAVKLPWPYSGSYFVKKKHRRSIRRGLVFLMVLCHCLFPIGNFVMVDSPRFPKSSGIGPKKALTKTTSRREFQPFTYIYIW